MGTIYLALMGVLAVLSAGAYMYFRAEQRNAERMPADQVDHRGHLNAIPTWPRLAKFATIGVTVMVGVMMSALAMVHQVQAGYVGVVYQFGDIVSQKEAGLVIIAPWQTMKEANTQVQRAEFPELDSFSEETQDVFIKATLNYRVDPKDIQELYRTVGPDYFNKLVPNRVNQLFKDETVKYKAVQIAPHREEIRKAVKEKLGAELARFSIFVEDLLIDNIKFSPAFTKAIEGKQIATQDAQTAQNRVREAEFKAQQVVKAAEGEAKAYRLKQRTLTPLLVQQNAIDKLNPNVQVILLPSDSNFLLPSSVVGGK